MKRVVPSLSVVLLVLGAVLVAGVRVDAPATSAAPLATVAAATTTPAPSAPATSVAPSASPTARPPIADGHRVRIPRLGIDLPIAEGDLERDAVRQATPEDWAFHLPGTAAPGEPGNTYLYAHARQGMFLSLWNARVGDEVVVVTPDARELRYVVREIHPRVPPSDVAWASPDGPERLTLQTSTGPSPGDARFVVIALPT